MGIAGSVSTFGTARWGLIVLAAGFAFFRVATDLPNATFLLFQARDIARAQLVADGSLILWGPEMTGGGKLPGALYYWLLALPLKLGGGWRSTWYLLAGTWGISWAVTFAFLDRALGWTSAFLALVIFLPASAYLAFLNSSMAPAFVMPSILGVILAYSARTAAVRGRAWALACLVSGLATQLHYTSITIPLAGLLLEALGPRIGVPRLGHRTLLKGLSLFLLTFLPYWLHLLLLAFGIPLGIPAPYEAGEAASAIPSLIQLAKDAVVELQPLVVASKISQLLPFPAFAAALTFLLVKPGPSERAKASQLKLHFSALLVLMLASAPSAIFYFLRPNGARYVAPLAICFLLLTGLLHHLATLNSKRALTYAALNTLGLLVFGFFGFVGSRNSEGWRLSLIPAMLAFFLLAKLLRREPLLRSPSSDGIALLMGIACAFAQTSANTVPWIMRETPLVRVEQIELLADGVIQRTGWTYDEARYRLFFIGGQMQSSLELIYRERYERLKQEGALGTNEKGWDGCFVVFGVKDLAALSQSDKTTWLSERRLQSDLKRGILDGGIRLVGKPIKGLRMAFVPYRVIDRERYPLHFQNLGHPYETVARALPIPPGEEPVGVKTLGKNRVLFHWNDCPGPTCATGVIVSYARKAGALAVQAEILGAPLEQTNEWTGPDWVQMWTRPYLKVRCGGREHSRDLADSVGINPAWAQRVEGMVQNYHSMLAPLKREFHVPCATGPEEFRVGRESTTIYRVKGPVTISPPEAVYRVNSD